jgi:hypothetical protein
VLPLLQATFASPEEFAAVFTAEISKKGLLVRGAALPPGAAPGSPIELEITVAGGTPVPVPARVAAVVPGVGVAVMFDSVPEALSALAGGEEKDDAPKGPLSERLKAMSVQEKMQMALSGSRDERLALFRDNVKSIHVFVLKNPRIGLDEVQTAAKSPQLAPDALKLIAEHRDWGANPTVCAALVRNPKTPIPLALKALERVPMSDLRTLAKGGAREQIVQAARRKISG